MEMHLEGCCRVAWGDSECLEDSIHSLRLLHRIAQKVIDFPSDDKFRTVLCSKIDQRILQRPGAYLLMKGMGFQRLNHEGLQVMHCEKDKIHRLEHFCSPQFQSWMVSIESDFNYNNLIKFKNSIGDVFKVYFFPYESLALVYHFVRTFKELHAPANAQLCSISPAQEIADVEFVTVEESGLFGSSVIVVDKGKARTQVQAETISSNDISVRLADRLKVSHIKKEQVVARERALEAFKEDRKQNKKQQ